MPREITDRDRVVRAVRNLSLTAELFEQQNGKPKYASDLEVISHGRDYGNGKQVGPYVRLLEFAANEQITRQGEWGGNNFYIAVEGALEVFVHDETGELKARENGNKRRTWRLVQSQRHANFVCEVGLLPCQRSVV